MGFTGGNGLVGRIGSTGGKGFRGGTAFVGNGRGRRGTAGLFVPNRLVSPGRLVPNRFVNRGAFVLKRFVSAEFVMLVSGSSPGDRSTANSGIAAASVKMTNSVFIDYLFRYQPIAARMPASHFNFSSDGKHSILLYCQGITAINCLKYLPDRIEVASDRKLQKARMAFMPKGGLQSHS